MTDKSNGNGTAASESVDPFDLEALRIDPTSETGSGGKKHLTMIAARKPHKHEWWRVNPDRDFRMNVAVIEYQRELYVTSRLISEWVPGEVRQVELRVCVTSEGVPFLYPVPLPSEDGRRNGWHESARACV